MQSHTLQTSPMRHPARRSLTAAVSSFGALDVLHNNVGIGGGDQPATRVDEEAWQRIFDVNLSAMWRTCKAVIPVMREAGRGAIVNISSIASICSTNTAAYQISKAGVNTLTQHLAMNVARHGIRVNAVLPGLMNTPMAIEGISAARGVDREDLITERDAAVPLGTQDGNRVGCRLRLTVSRFGRGQVRHRRVAARRRRSVDTSRLTARRA